MADSLVIDAARVREAGSHVEAASAGLADGRVDQPVGGLDGFSLVKSCIAGSLASVEGFDAVRNAWSGWAAIAIQAANDFERTDAQHAVGLGGVDGGH